MSSRVFDCSISQTVWFVCMLSQNCGVTLNARARRTAISAPTALRPAMMACTVWREMPMWSAKASTVMPSASRLRLTIRPGCTGRKPERPAGVSLPMVVLDPYVNSFLVLPLEDQAEEPPDFDGVPALAVPLEGVEIPAGLRHVLWLDCRV